MTKKIKIIISAVIVLAIGLTAICSCKHFRREPVKKTYSKEITEIHSIPSLQAVRLVDGETIEVVSTKINFILLNNAEPYNAVDKLTCKKNRAFTISDMHHASLSYKFLGVQKDGKLLLEQCNRFNAISFGDGITEHMSKVTMKPYDYTNWILKIDCPPYLSMEGLENAITDKKTYTKYPEWKEQTILQELTKEYPAIKACIGIDESNPNMMYTWSSTINYMLGYNQNDKRQVYLNSMFIPGPDKIPGECSKIVEDASPYLAKILERKIRDRFGLKD